MTTCAGRGEADACRRRVRGRRCGSCRCRRGDAALHPAAVPLHRSVAGSRDWRKRASAARLPMRRPSPPSFLRGYVMRGKRSACIPTELGTHGDEHDGERTSRTSLMWSSPPSMEEQAGQGGRRRSWTGSKVLARLLPARLNRRWKTGGAARLKRWRSRTSRATCRATSAAR